MGYQLTKNILLSEIAQRVGLEFKGADLEVRGVSSFTDCSSGELSFTNDLSGFKPNTILVVPKDSSLKQLNSTGYLLSDNPRLDFIRILSFLNDIFGFSTYDFTSDIHPTAVIGKNVVIEDGCKIAEGVIIEHNTVIHSGTQVGKNSRIRSSSSVGGDGFGFERLGDGEPLRFPHLGGVVIGENVEVGSLNSIARGTLSNTEIHSDVKTDNLVHIAHNCIIGEKTIITACAQFSGGVIVGEGCWIGPNCSILQKIKIGKNSLIGIGAVVTKDIPNNTVFAGNPAKKIRDIK
ncbi:UDP-3-O-(3-hydroxymyristoyl)glucosamine N-acyltransferase [Marinomonas aquiplantarum]|uniref:UDP-3-O-[3-hydroxymyristoyl] glucosamine N-acyltransferase n=1 Tax=Marinomonas aquiplantarum TaxID=491951 RepID=A0A366D6Q8_9GAMM|nr:UDP-3-O-(3-hydroxymyristoyl)glucosamine N-acyltransferase [Marinomonas aquiplantarum]RBO85732.1 UDP-3-O-[3-hydroxymyristoyl] glucosamine N-acyltransferase [Marinomonas aquiplantarum]